MNSTGPLLDLFRHPLLDLFRLIQCWIRPLLLNKWQYQGALCPLTPTNHVCCEIPAYSVITDKLVQPVQYLVTPCYV